MKNSGSSQRDEHGSAAGSAEIETAGRINRVFSAISETIGMLDSSETLPNGYFDLDMITKDWTKSSDDGLFENMAVCIFAGGMRIATLQKKWVAIRQAFRDFRIAQVATLDAAELLSNKSVIRHPGKVRAIISNAQKIQQIQSVEGSFVIYLAERKKRGVDYLRDCVVRDFDYLGPATGADFLKDIGMGGYKPDVHFTRILQRIGLWNGDSSGLSDVVKLLTSATGLPSSDIDRLLFRYGSGLKLKYAVCGERPVCDVCKVVDCSYRSGVATK